MKTRLAAGVEVDILTASEVKAELAAHRRAILSELSRARPISKAVLGSGVLDGSGNGTIDLGAPATGRQWDVRRITVFYQSPAAVAAAGRAVLYRANDVADATDANPRGVVWKLGDNLPVGETFSANEATYKQDEKVIVRLAGGTVSVAVFAVAQVIESRTELTFDVDTDTSDPEAPVTKLAAV